MIGPKGVGSVSCPLTYSTDLDGLCCKLPRHLFANGTPASQDASARDEAIAPMLRRKDLSQSAQTPTMILAYEGL